jgi:hypothetical protein
MFNQTVNVGPGSCRTKEFVAMLQACLVKSVLWL